MSNILRRKFGYRPKKLFIFFENIKSSLPLLKLFGFKFNNVVEFLFLYSYTIYHTNIKFISFNFITDKV